MLLARIFTLYPDFFPGPLGKGLYGKAMEKKIWDMETVNIRDYATDKHKTVDDTLYGGGFGMLIKPDVLAKALDKKLPFICANPDYESVENNSDKINICMGTIAQLYKSLGGEIFILGKPSIDIYIESTKKIYYIIKKELKDYIHSIQISIN